MLTGKQKRFLRALASQERATFQVGKDGLSYNIYNTVNDYLDVHELVKISLLKTCSQEIREVALDLSANTNSEVVQIIGRVIVLYRPSKEKVIDLPHA